MCNFTFNFNVINPTVYPIIHDNVDSEDDSIESIPDLESRENSEDEGETNEDESSNIQYINIWTLQRTAMMIRVFHLLDVN